MIKTVISLLTFIPWLLYYVEIIYYRIAVIESVQLDSTKYFRHMNKNLFSSINMKELILYFIFVAFMQYKNTAVLEILFTATYIYLLIDFFFTLAEHCKKIKHIKIMVLNILLITLVILYYLIFKKLYTTYNIMFTISIMSSLIVLLFSKSYKK